ncbi:MAG: hypothetical protein P8046_14570, partial [Anaerolineales bacterium]
AIYTLFQVYTNLIGSKSWNPKISKAGTYFTIALDTQLLVGFMLYFVFSPLTKAFFKDIGAGMSNPTLRFFGMEHFLIMLVAIVFAHIGSAVSKKEFPDDTKLQRAAIFFTISLLLILFGIPWTSRPLLPGL